MQRVAEIVAWLDTGVGLQLALDPDACPIAAIQAEFPATTEAEALEACHFIGARPVVEWLDSERLRLLRREPSAFYKLLGETFPLLTDGAWQMALRLVEERLRAEMDAIDASMFRRLDAGGPRH